MNLLHHIFSLFLCFSVSPKWHQLKFQMPMQDPSRTECLRQKNDLLPDMSEFQEHGVTREAEDLCNNIRKIMLNRKYQNNSMSGNYGKEKYHMRAVVCYKQHSIDIRKA